MIKTVFFDFDGVLTLDATGTTTIINYIVNVTGIDREVFEKAYRKHNKQLLFGQIVHNDVWENICNEVKRDISIDILHDSFINTPIDMNMLELVQELKNLGYKTGIITDNKKDRIDAVYEHFAFEEYFDEVIVSAQVGSGKDSEEIFTKIMGNLSVDPSECVFIDNNKKNLIIPNQLGMRGLFFHHDIRDFDELRRNLIRNRVEL